MTLTKTESFFLHAIITGNTDKLKGYKKYDKAMNSLIEKGFLRLNDFCIVELNLHDTYFQSRGYSHSKG